MARVRQGEGWGEEVSPRESDEMRRGTESGMQSDRKKVEQDKEEMETRRQTYRGWGGSQVLGSFYICKNFLEGGRIVEGNSEGG